MFGFSSFSESPFSALPELGNGAQNLEPARYDNSQNFFSPTVTTSITLTAARLDNNNTFYEHTVTRGVVYLTPDLFENQNTFYGAIVTQEDGEQFIEPEILVNQNVFYIHLITVSAQPVVEGGAKGASKKRKKRFYVERNGKIYIFANEYLAEAFIQSEEQAKTKNKKVAKKVPELASQPLEKINIGSIKELADKYSKKQYFTDLINKNDYDQLVYQYRLLLTLETQARLIESQDEEEISILLMAA